MMDIPGQQLYVRQRTTNHYWNTSRGSEETLRKIKQMGKLMCFNYLIGLYTEFGILLVLNI